jgi:hypothetical protein
MYCLWEYSQGQVGSSGRKNRRSMEVMKVGEVNFGAFAPARTAAYACGLRPSSITLVLASVAILFCGSRLHPEPEREMREQNKPLPIKKELLMLDRQIHPSPSRFESLRIFAVARAEVYPSMYSSLL